MKKKALNRAVVMATLGATTLLTNVAHAVLEEVIVTANKRAESANDIGLSVSALSGDKLVEQKLTSLEEITTAVPGLHFATSQQNTPILSLRGVGFNESSLGVYPATSLYVDEIPLPFPVMAAHSAYDLERVEVLKGPQGVLFGQNATGGAINFIAAKPTDELSYGGDISYGRFDKVETNAFVSGRLSETVGARLALQSVKADEWQKSVTSGRENGKEDYTAGRFTLSFDPADDLHLTANINAWQDKSDPLALQVVAKTPKRPDAAPDRALEQSTIPLVDDDSRAGDWTNEPKGDKSFWQTSLRGDYTINDTLTLTALVAHSDYEQDQVQDGDGSHLSMADFTDKGELESTFAEIRLAGDSGGELRWLIGANYEDSKTSEDQFNELLNNTTYRGSVNFIHRTTSVVEQDIESFALFGNVDYDLNEALTLKLGARYTDTEIDVVSCNFDPGNAPGAISGPFDTIGANTASFFNFLGTNFGSVPFDMISIGDCFTLNDNNVPGEAYVDTLAEDNVSWRAGLDYRFNDDTLLYANVSQGYKAGSYPTLAANLYEQLNPVTQESVLAYEIGLKQSLADNTVQLNSAVFYYEYEDKQERGKTITLFGALDNLVNVDESTVFGVEVDLVAQLTDQLTVTAAVTYLDTEIDQFQGFDVYGNPDVDFSGNPLPFTPDWGYSFDVDYRIPLNNGGEVFMGINVIGQSESDAVFAAGNLSIADVLVPAAAPIHGSVEENYFVIDSFTTVGARLGYESEDERWKVMLWGKNITDEYYYNTVIASTEGGVRVAAKPATYGITVGYRY